MKPRHWWIAAILSAAGFASAVPAAVQPLSGLVDPTVQTLIDMGSSPVSVGDDLFSNFSMINALPGTGVTAAQIQVQPDTAGGSGMQFVSSWFAADGTLVDEVLSFDVQAADPAEPIALISLLSNGTAPAPAQGTFTSDTLVSQLPGGATAAPVITTYNDGVAAVSGSASPDVNYAQTALAPQIELQISDTVFESSTAPSSISSGGVATESILQNVFANVPEPGRAGWILVPVVALGGTLRRSRTAPRPRQI